eukprot:GFUD01009645.1.p1 GENE.GFUD01009645.1~~GFUD01009645.1.p1  ORF type:complete len:484 (+),score=137.53 GFUD01009645.1:53-1504(+)
MAETENLDLILEKMSSSLPKDVKLSPEMIHQGFSQDAKPSNLVSPSMTRKSFSKTSPSGPFPPNSPLTLRSRKVTSPSSTSFSFLSPSDHISSLYQSKLSDSTSDISEIATPLSTPLLGRKRTSSNSFEVDRFPPAPSSTMSRSSSTMSLCSNVSQATSGLPPLDRLLKHLRERISGSLFSGWYTERRYVDAIDRYRDVILVDSVEALIIKQVKYAIRKCGKILAENSFIGLTDVDDESKLFINLGAGGAEASHAFGHYWFQLRSINFMANVGFTLEVVVVRQFVSSDSDSCWKCKARASQPADSPPVKIDSIGAALVDMRSRLYTVSSDVLTEVWQPGTYWAKLRPLLTVSNVVHLGKLLLVLILALFTGLIAGVKQLAQFSLRLLHELANLVDRSTPLALGALNIMSKVVGGAYLLVAMVWRDTVKKPVSAGPATARPQLTSLPAMRSPLPPPPDMGRQASQPRADTRGVMDNMYSQGRNW